jgi:predicted permease
MQALVAVVLLLCCFNVGGLMMSRFYSRQHEFAIRKAMGGSRWRLIRQYLLESSLIAVAGGALGAVAASFGSAALVKFFVDPRMPVPVRPDAPPDATMLLVTAGLAICATMLFGFLPAWHAGRSDPGGLLKSRTAMGGRKQLVGRLFVPVQVALSLVLVMIAGLLSQSMIHLRGENVGFDAHVIIQRQFLYHKLPQKDDDTFLDVYQRILDRLEKSPGIQSVAITAQLPVDRENTTSRFQAAGGDQETVLAYNHVGPGYFRTMQTKLIAGSEFERGKRDRSVCIVNESAAQYLFPNEPAIGRSVKSVVANSNRFPAGSCRIIGIVENSKFVNFRESAPRTSYFPITKESIPVFGNFVFVIRSPNETAAIAAYRKAAAEIVPAIPLERFATLEQEIDETFGRERLITIMSDFFGGLSLLLSAIGLYGLLSSSVTQRTAEMGVRLALGARRKTVLWMILKDAVRLVSVGTLAGAAVLYMTVEFFRGLLYHISPFDPATLVGAACLLLAVAFLAAWLPAFRASRVDPIVALKYE